MKTRWLARNKSFNHFLVSGFYAAWNQEDRWESVSGLFPEKARYKVLSIKKVKRIKKSWVTWSILLDDHIRHSRYNDNDLYIVTVESNDPIINDAPIIKNFRHKYIDKRAIKIG